MQWQHRKETSRRERNTPGGPTSPTRAAIHNGTFHSTGSMAFGSGVPASPSLHRQTSSRSGNGSLIGSPSPRTKGSGGGGGGGSGWGSGSLNLSTPGATKAGIGRTGSASSNSSMVSAGGGPMVDSRGGAGQQHGAGGGEGARAAGAAGGAGAGAGGEGGKDPAVKSLPSTPQKNPLLMKSFTPSPTSKGLRQARIPPSTFASTGGSQ